MKEMDSLKSHEAVAKVSELVVSERKKECLESQEAVAKVSTVCGKEQSSMRMSSIIKKD